MKRVVEGNLGGHPVYSVHGTVLGVGPWYRLTSSSDTGHNNTTVRERKDLMIAMRYLNRERETQNS